MPKAERSTIAKLSNGEADNPVYISIHSASTGVPADLVRGIELPGAAWLRRAILEHPFSERIVYEQPIELPQLRHL